MALRVAEGAPRDNKGKKTRQRKRPEPESCQRSSERVCRRRLKRGRSGGPNKGDNQVTTHREIQEEEDPSEKEGASTKKGMKVFAKELDGRIEAVRREYQKEKEEPEGEQPWGQRVPPDRGGRGRARRSFYIAVRTHQPKSQSINLLDRVHHKAGEDRT